MTFETPYALYLLVVVAVIAAAYAIEQVRRKRYAARFSNVSLLASIVPKRPGWRRHVTFALLLLSLAVLTVGAAHPAAQVRVPREKATVMLAIDVSLSMEATDVLPDRITAAKKAASTFAEQLPPKINLGLVAFGGTASVLVPPTTDRDVFTASVNKLELQESTAIGDAVHSSIVAIQTFAQSTTAKNEKPAPARIVLLSDGSNNSGRKLSVAEDEAQAAHIPVSTIAFGTPDGTVDLPGYGPQRVPADRVGLQNLAEKTGGSFHTATSVEELKTIYANIGSQIGYTTAQRDISYRFLVAGLAFGMLAAAAALLWAGRLT